MTMAEFNIRLFAFNRMSKREEILVREIAYNSYIGGSLNLKKLPSKDKFWDLGLKKDIPKISDKARQMFRDAQIKYKEQNG